MNFLVPNLGTTSLKYQILEMPSEKVLASGRFERVADYREAIAQICHRRVPIDAVALKAVHGRPALSRHLPGRSRAWWRLCASSCPPRRPTMPST